MNKIKPVIVVCGPSESGKTRYAHEICAHFDQNDVIDNWNGEDLLVAGDIAFTSLSIEQFLPDASERYRVMSIYDALDAIGVAHAKTEAVPAVEPVMQGYPHSQGKKPSDSAWWKSRTPLEQAFWNAACCEATPEQMAMCYYHLINHKALCQRIADAEGMSGNPKFIDDFAAAAHNFAAMSKAFVEYSTPDNTEEDDAAPTDSEGLSAREIVLKRVIDGFRDTLASVAEQAIKTAYTDYLPYVESDTDSNIAWLVQGCVSNIIAGKFEKKKLIGSDTEYLEVLDGNGVSHLIIFSEYSQVVEPLSRTFGDAIKDSRIKQLETQLTNLTRSAFRS